MSYRSETPFDNIENSHKYISMLAEAIAEAQADVDNQMQLAISEQAERRQEALQLVSYHLVKLNAHIANSRRVLNDLRSLRRLLLEERRLPFSAREKSAGISA